MSNFVDSNSESQVRSMLRQFVQDEFLYNKPEISLSDDLNIIEQGLVDSMDIFRIIQFIENNTTVRWEPEEMVQSNFQTINDMTRLVLEKMNVKK